MIPKAYSYIRFSRPEQEKGDSYRRQVKEAEKYAEEKGFKLDQELTDRGLSAFHGVHRDKGHLGEFLSLVKAGEIDKGSMLIVENFDRLSREDILTAFDQFRDIIRAGIRIVTLQDRMEYSEKSVSTNPTQLIISISIMQRAHEESLTKSRRLKEAWVEKRRLAQERKKDMTKRIPAWIGVDNDGKMYPIKERCLAIEQIFNMRLTGWGPEKITKELNQYDNVWKPPKSNRNKYGGWRGSYVTKILFTKEVIGEFQPHKIEMVELENGRVKKTRVPDSDPIPDYYPKAIEENLFYRVHELIARNRAEGKSHGGGKTGKANNLFTHIVKCSICGAPMHFIDKGPGSKGGRYLHCDVARRAVEHKILIILPRPINQNLLEKKILNRCPARPVKYDEFEKLFFEYLSELDISKLLPTDNALGQKIKDLEGNLAKLKENYDRLSAMHVKIKEDHRKTLDDEKRSIIVDSIILLQAELRSNASSQKEIKKELDIVRNQQLTIRKNIDQVKEVYGYLSPSENEKESIAKRLILRNEIRRLVEWVEISPLSVQFVEKIKLSDKHSIYPGALLIMTNKYIENITIKFRGVDKTRVIPTIKIAEKNPDGTMIYVDSIDWTGDNKYKRYFKTV